MIEADKFLGALQKNGINFFTGVPDSLLKDVCAYINQNLPSDRHIIATNEGSAVGLAIGHYLATSNPALVYMQNSGLGNAINPLVSLADSKIYGIPMVLMIGWRGEIQTDKSQLKDEPQHLKQGRITLGQLELLGIPWELIDKESDIENKIEKLAKLTKERAGPVALVVRKGTFATFKENFVENATLPKREQVISSLLEHIPDNFPIVSTTGMASRELFELRKAKKNGHQRDFLTVGGMGHALAIASGIALGKTDNKVVCMDGDGALLMHMGALAVSSELENLIHVVLNNGAHDSVGGQPTRAAEVCLSDIARCCGYSLTLFVDESADIIEAVNKAVSYKGSVFLEIKCRRGSRKDLGRPDRTPIENRDELMKFLRGIL
jgi:phosphonopyruvate decarboxylase